MKTRLFSIPFLIAALAFVSCEKEFELKVKSTTPKLYVECFAGYADTTYVSIYKTTSINGAYSKGTGFTVSDISLKDDGKDVELHKISNSLWWTANHFEPESRISFDVSTLATGSVKAESTIPKAVDFSVDTSRVIGADADYLQFHIKINDKIGENDHFAVALEEIHYYIAGEDTTYYSMTDAPIQIVQSNSLFSALEGGGLKQASFNISAAEQSFHVSLLEPEDFENSCVDVACYANDSTSVWLNKYDDYYYEDGDDGEEELIRYQNLVDVKVLLFRLSNECSSYLIARYNQQNNLLAELGLCPPNYAYSNIEGGYGVFSGISVSESDWIRH